MRSPSLFTALKYVSLFDRRARLRGAFLIAVSDHTGRRWGFLLVLTAVAAVSSSLERTSGFAEEAKSLLLPASVSEVTIAAGALGDVRYLAVPP
jgi:hypothetical protein